MQNRHKTVDMERVSRRRTSRRFVLLSVIVVPLLGACTAEARSDAAFSLFIKAVNLKCKVSKSEARLAWSIGDELGADDKARALQASARQQTDRLIAQIERLSGPGDIRQEVGDLFAKSSAVLKDVSNGKVSADEGQARLNDLREQARDRGLGECVSR